MKRPKITDKECQRQGMSDVPIANYSKIQDKYIDHLESKLKELTLKDIKKSPLKIDLKWWQHTCGDGCCYTDGMDIFLNDEKLDEQNAEDSKNALTAILTKLGYKFEISSD
jgi:hypothetical protein